MLFPNKYPFNIVEIPIKGMDNIIDRIGVYNFWLCNNSEIGFDNKIIIIIKMILVIKFINMLVTSILDLSILFSDTSLDILTSRPPLIIVMNKL